MPGNILERMQIQHTVCHHLALLLIGMGAQHLYLVTLLVLGEHLLRYL